MLNMFTRICLFIKIKTRINFILIVKLSLLSSRCIKNLYIDFDNIQYLTLFSGYTFIKLVMKCVRDGSRRYCTSY